MRCLGYQFLLFVNLLEIWLCFQGDLSLACLPILPNDHLTLQHNDPFYPYLLLFVDPLKIAPSSLLLQAYQYLKLFVDPLKAACLVRACFQRMFKQV